MKRIIAYLLMFLVYACLASCNNVPEMNYSLDKDINLYPKVYDYIYTFRENYEEYADPTRIEKLIKQSDFCISGKPIIEKFEIINWPDGKENYYPNLVRVSGKIKVENIVYGNPGLTEIPFSVKNFYGDLFPFGQWGEIRDPWENIILRNLIVKKPTLVIIGKGGGSNLSFIYVIDISLHKWENESVVLEAYKKIRELELLPNEQFEKERDNLIKKTNSVELMNYLYRRTIWSLGLDNAIAMIRDILSNNNISLMQRLQGYGFAVTSLDYFHPELSKTRRYGDTIPYLDSKQQNELEDIILKEISNVKLKYFHYYRYISIGKSSSYLGTIFDRLIKVDSEFKAKLKTTIDAMTERFDKTKNIDIQYPLWDEWKLWLKWTEKLFSDKTQDNKKEDAEENEK